MQSIVLSNFSTLVQADGLEIEIPSFFQQKYGYIVFPTAHHSFIVSLSFAIVRAVLEIIALNVFRSFLSIFFFQAR